jgi:protein AATF/BFR2
VSRTALDEHEDEHEDPLAPVEEDSDDPFSKRAMDSEDIDDSERDDDRGVEMAVAEGEIAEDDEIDSDEAFGEGDITKFESFKFSGSKSRQSAKKNIDKGSASTTESSESDEVVADLESDDLDGQTTSDEEMESGEDVDMDDEDFPSETEDSDDDSVTTASTTPEVLAGTATTTTVSSDRAALKAILANDTAAVTSTLSAAADADAKKGKAVKRQYQTFDRLLDARIKLQKGLAAANDLTPEFVSKSENSLAIQKVEEAALSLWFTIESIRHSLLDTQLSSNDSAANSKKRKRPPPATTKTPTPELWSRTQSLSTQTLAHDRLVLDKWSSKARAASALPGPRSQLIDRSSQSRNNITAILDTYLASESDKLVAQASSTPLNLSSTAHTQPASIYDDTPFYQSLLRDLIASRTSVGPLSNLAAATTTATLLPSVTRLHPRGSKNKHVDTKASKGRKVRYTVHEKLQNFAAEEERGTWEESARTEFFGSLFGARRMLDETEHVEDRAEDGEAEALRLFRN